MSITYEDPYKIAEKIKNNDYSTIDKFILNNKAQLLKRDNSVDKLISIDILRSKIDAHPYQMKVALEVLKNMNGNAILADEVGLGKTIEAGIIIKEMLTREMISKVLIIAPKALLNQWKEEMSEKFAEEFVIATDTDFKGFDAHDKLICSTGIARHRAEEIQKNEWDLLIVDEAHLYRNHTSKSRKALSDIQRKHTLLLTATPINNKLSDLYSLVDLIDSGLFGSLDSFKTKYMADARGRKVMEGSLDELKAKLKRVMCRTRRIDTDIPFSKRFVESRRIDPSEEETEFLDKSTEYLRDLCSNKYKDVEKMTKNKDLTDAQSRAILIFNATSIQQSLSSSPQAAAKTLKNRYSMAKTQEERNTLDSLISMASKIKSSKMKLLRQIAEETNEQAVIFCLRKATAKEIKKNLSDLGRTAVYSGDITTFKERREMIENFRSGKIKYLVATDAAAEGLNLQHCNILFNYDLHWNPMKIEQRIGRVHRFGQEKDVTIFNLCIKDTIDDYVLHILFQKINLFTMAIGSMETILSEIKEDDSDIEKTIMDIIMRSKDKLDIQSELERLREDIDYASKKQAMAQQFTEGVLG